MMRGGRIRPPRRVRYLDIPSRRVASVAFANSGHATAAYGARWDF